jgi:hypothetical protein
MHRTPLAPVAHPTKSDITDLGDRLFGDLIRPGNESYDSTARLDHLAIRHLTARLLAARLEDDNSILVRISDPADAGASLLVSFPDTPGQPSAGAGHAEARMRRARAAFIDSIVLPPFEGYALLYGLARLTLAEPEEAGGLPRVLDFVALDGIVPATGGTGRIAAA